jgi:hypothetical protein
MEKVNVTEIETRISENEAKVVFNMLKVQKLLKPLTDLNFPSYSKGKAKLELTLKSAKLTYSDGSTSTYQEI